MDTPEKSSSAVTESRRGPMCCEILWMATVIKLKQAMKIGSHGMSSFLEGPADKTAMSRRTSATAAVNGPNLDHMVSRHAGVEGTRRGGIT